MSRRDENENDGSADDAVVRPPPPLVVVLAGPTGVGKSDVAMRLCRPDGARRVLSGRQRGPRNVDDDDASRYRGEIVSADSVQAYRGVTVGANKPSAEDAAEVRHHLVDVVDASGSYSAAEWCRDATRVVEELTTPNDDDDDDEYRSRRQTTLPVVVGGTMMYLQWLVRGRPDAGRPTPEAVARAERFVTECRRPNDDDDGWSRAVAHASSFGPVFRGRVERLPGKDWYRLRRTLEVAYTSSSEHANTDADALFTGARADALAGDVRCFFLCPNDRATHASVVDRRCETMLTRGLLRETTDLRTNGDLPADGQPARAIGYRQALEYLEKRARAKADEKDDDDESPEEAFGRFLETFATATRQYAKKQMSWFRKDGRFVFVPVRLVADDDDDDDQPKTEVVPAEQRVAEATDAIVRLCRLSREDYEAELARPDGVSANTIRRNQDQAKGMKFHRGDRRYVLTKGSEALRRVIEEAEDCAERLRPSVVAAAAET